MALHQFVIEMLSVPAGSLAQLHPNHDDERGVVRERPLVEETLRMGGAVATRNSRRTVTFGELLRQHRSAARLSQEKLAECARISVRGLSNLERGVIYNPQRYTIQALIDALGLSSTDADAFRDAARCTAREARRQLLTN